MGYSLIKGQFHLFYRSERHVGARPDGDSIWFKPNDRQQLRNLGGRSVDYNGGGFAQLRFEGIDALELHYKGSNHQKVPECAEARDRVLRLVGFTTVTYAPTDNIDTSVRTASPHPIAGYILSRNVDPYGRPVAFAFVGSTSQADGSEVWLTDSWMSRSLNARLVSAGHAYPAYYTGLPTDLRNRLTRLTTNARNARKGIWRVDSSLSGANIRNASALERFALWPKLYRRLFAYFSEGNSRISGFETWLRADSERDDALWIISRGELGNMHDIFSVTGNRIQMHYGPHDIVITPR